MRGDTGPGVIATDITAGVGLTTPAPAARHVRVLLSPLLQEGLENFAVGFTEVPGHVQGTRHSHADSAEVWLVFEGRGIARVGNEEFEVGPGSVIYTPRRTSHQFVNPGPDPVKLFFVYAPSGGERSVLDGSFR